MRKFLVFLILIGVLLVGGYFLLDSQLNSNGNSTAVVTADKFITADGIDWYQDPDKKFNLAVFDKPFAITFTPENAQTLKEQGFLNDYSLAVNGTYFRGSYVESEHSGLLQLKGERIWDLIPDKQLTHVVVYDEKLDKLSFVATSDLDESEYKGTQFTLFQTGPLMINNGVTQTQGIKDSLNGEGRFLRTVLGTTDDGKKFILITRVNYTLSDLAADIESFPVFKGKHIDVVNLDGGTSTAMYSRQLDQFNYRENSRLPVVIGVK